MAYVESYYLDANVDQEIAQENPQEEPAIFTQNQKQNAPEPVSDYCGFVGEELPPIYRQQIRLASQMLSVRKPASYLAPISMHQEQETQTVEEHGGSGYAWGAQGAQQQSEHSGQSCHEYLIGFSAPKQNDLVHTRRDHELPKMRSVTATANHFRLNGTNWIKGSNYEQSKYLVMEDENFDKVNAPPKTNATTHIASELASNTGSARSTASTTSMSTHTAQLGPKFGYLTASPNGKSAALSRAEKYKGLSAFRPVGESVQSQYAYEDLN